jgi:cytochrome c5
MKLTAIIGAIAISSLLGAGPAAAADGKAVFEKSCAGCHKSMSPKVTEKDKWAPILKKGQAAMVASVVKGKGVMPPKGGAASEDDVKAAVQYLETLVK